MGLAGRFQGLGLQGFRFRVYRYKLQVKVQGIRFCSGFGVQISGRLRSDSVLEFRMARTGFGGTRGRKNCGGLPLWHPQLSS